MKASYISYVFSQGKVIIDKASNFDVAMALLRDVCSSLSVKEITKKLGVSRNMLRLWLSETHRGKRPKILQKLAKLLNIPLDYLLD